MAENDTILDNCEIAILTMVNELAARWRLKPYDFSAHVDYPIDLKSPDATLEYDQCPGDAEKKQRFFEMLKSIGIANKDDWSLSGSEMSIIDALDSAIAVAPNARSRRQ